MTALACAWAASAAWGQGGFIDGLSSQYLIIARDEVNGNTDVGSNNFELGANKAPVPCTDDFLDGGSSGGPTLEGAVPALPGNAAPVVQGVCGDGNIAITDTTGELNLQDTGVYGDPTIGIRMAGPSNLGLNSSSNSFFNDPNLFPNTFDPMTQTGTTVSAAAAVQSTRIDPGTDFGITYSFDHSALLAELSGLQIAINGLAPTDTLNVSANGGKISTDTTFTADPGLNVVDIITGDNDFLVENSNFVIDGPAGAVVIFRLPDSDNMLLSNANVLLGNSGITTHSVLFYTDQDETDTHFSFSNAIVNGAAFWSLTDGGGQISLSNVQGCTQLVADIVEMDNVRLCRCAFVPEPATMGLLAAGGAVLLRRKRRR